MNYFEKIEQWGGNIAFNDTETQLTYDELVRVSDSMDLPADRSLVFCLATNTIAMGVGLVGIMRKRDVPVLISASLEKNLYEHLYSQYKPQYIWGPADHDSHGEPIWEYRGYKLFRTEYAGDKPRLADDLALLLTTSGSTGSPKLVRQTYRNIESNTDSIAQYLRIASNDRAITTLPLNYTYGLSIFQSHLLAGAQIVFTEKSFFDRDFWKIMVEQKVTTFGGVPYNYQILDKLHFFDRDIQYLRYITQAGGRLGEELHHKFAEGMKTLGKEFIVMYGATEATARMSYVPAENSVKKAGSIGIAIPGGRFEIIDVDGSVVQEADKIGELVYYGDNVTPGYAECREDLCKEDERRGRLETGDMAKRDSDGYYYIVGRKKRFLKIFGNRINLVEVEDILNSAGYECACVGEDDHMRIYTTSTETAEIVSFISEKLGIHHSAFTAIHIDSIPRNDSGKVLYSSLE